MKMKKALFALILVGFITNLNAQIVLEKVYNFEEICPACTTKVKAFNTENKTFYYIVATDFINIYNQDHSLYKQVSVKNANESFLDIFLPSDNLFNSDELIEFIALKRINDTYSFVLMTENGDSIMYVGHKNCDGYQFQAGHNGFDLIQYMRTIDNKSKLIVNGTENMCDSVFVYNLPGTLTEAQEYLLKSQSLSLFPNPSSDFITIRAGESATDRVLKIFNNNGKVIFETTIYSGDNDKTIDVSKYKSGVYLYTIDNKSGKFIVK